MSSIEFKTWEEFRDYVTEIEIHKHISNIEGPFACLRWMNMSGKNGEGRYEVGVHPINSLHRTKPTYTFEGLCPDDIKLKGIYE